MKPSSILVAVVAGALVLAGAPGRGVADPGGGGGGAVAAGGVPARQGQVIALLPLAADHKLRLYGQPVASAVARALERDGLSVVVVSSSAPVPSKARLVIDGRIVRGDGDQVLLEARVRDPALGTVVASLSASAPSLTRIDEAAADLAAKLIPALRDGLAAQERPATGGAAGHGGAATASDEAGDAGGDAAATTADPRPVAVLRVVWPAALTADDDNPDLEPLLEAGATRLAGMVGHRGARVTGDDLAAAMAAQGGDLGITVELAEIHYTDGGVITARARGRVRVVDATGVVFDRVIRTDTLVGGRGDRRHAVARAAVEQIVDVAYGRVRELLAARREAR